MQPGNTPLVDVNGIFAKLECTNPCGSVKDRIAKYIIDESEKRGLLRTGMKIVEASSGNTGISLTYYARQKGYEVVIVMPENMTDERKQILSRLGAELVLCSAGNFAEAAAIRDKMATDPEYFNPDQFSNPLNVECHQKTTGQELLTQMRDRGHTIDAFVAGVGTGGTLIGVGKALREVFPNVFIAAVEPLESPVMSGGSNCLHGIGGIGDGFIPPIAGDGQGGLHELIDEVLCIHTNEAHRAAVELEEQYGLCVGMSSGANYTAAQRLRSKFPSVVTMFADGYAKYRSQGLGQRKKGRCIFEGQRKIAVLKETLNRVQLQTPPNPS